MDNLRSMLENVSTLELVTEIEPGKRIGLKCELVEVITENRLVASVPIHNGRRYPLETGTRMLVFFKKEDMGVCHFHGVIISRQMADGEPVMTIQMVSQVGKNQRRDYFRLPLVTDVILRLPTGSTTEKQVNNGRITEVEVISYRELSVITKDISGGGLRTLMNERIEPGQKLRVIIPLERERVEVSAEVVRCQLFDEVLKRYDCGIRFLDVEEKDRSRIIAFIFDKQRNLRKKGLV